MRGDDRLPKKKKNQKKTNQLYFQKKKKKKKKIDDGKIDELFATIFQVPKGTLTIYDKVLLYEICLMVIKRSARLIAVALSTVIIKMSVEKNCTVAVDGSLFKYTPYYQHYLQQALHQLGLSDIKLHAISDGSGVGAALICAMNDKRTTNLA